MCALIQSAMCLRFVPRLQKVYAHKAVTNTRLLPSLKPLHIHCHIFCEKTNGKIDT